MEEAPKAGVRLWMYGGDANAQELQLEVYVDIYNIYIYIYIYYQSEGFPLNRIFDPCACLLAGGCGACRLLARRRRRYSVPVPLGGP